MNVRTVRFGAVEQEMREYRRREFSWAGRASRGDLAGRQKSRAHPADRFLGLWGRVGDRRLCAAAML